MNIIKIRLLSTLFCILFFSQTYATERNQTLEEYRIKIICRTAEYIYKHNDNGFRFDFNCKYLDDIRQIANDLRRPLNRDFIKAIVEEGVLEGFNFRIQEDNSKAIEELKEQIINYLIRNPNIKPEREQQPEFIALKNDLNAIAGDYQTKTKKIEQHGKQATIADQQTQSTTSSYNVLYYLMIIVVIIAALAIYYFVHYNKKRYKSSSNNKMHDTPSTEHLYSSQTTSHTTGTYNKESKDILDLKNIITELKEQIKKLTEESHSNQAIIIESIKNLAESLNHQDPPKKKNSAMLVKTQPTTKVPEQKPKTKVYAYTPNANAGLFDDLKNDDKGNPAYIITIDNHNTASFEITNNDVAQQKAMNGSSTFLQPACEYNNDINDGNKIRTLQKGKLTKQGNHWKIEKKALIEFYY